jgi:transposase-like protein
MNENQKSESAVSSPALKGNKVRRKLSAEKKFQIYLEAQRSDQPVGDILRREGLYAADLTRIRDQVREGALERLSARPGKRPQMVPRESYEALKQELEKKERALAEYAMELTIMQKKTNGGSWER